MNQDRKQDLAELITLYNETVKQIKDLTELKDTLSEKLKSSLPLGKTQVTYKNGEVVTANMIQAVRTSYDVDIARTRLPSQLFAALIKETIDPKAAKALRANNVLTQEDWEAIATESVETRLVIK